MSLGLSGRDSGTHQLVLRALLKAWPDGLTAAETSRVTHCHPTAVRGALTWLRNRDLAWAFASRGVVIWGASGAAHHASEMLR